MKRPKKRTSKKKNQTKLVALCFLGLRQMYVAFIICFLTAPLAAVGCWRWQAQFHVKRVTQRTNPTAITNALELPRGQGFEN
jgi:hypothetical protein